MPFANTAATGGWGSMQAAASDACNCLTGMLPICFPYRRFCLCLSCLPSSCLPEHTFFLLASHGSAILARCSSAKTPHTFASQPVPSFPRFLALPPLVQLAVVIFKYHTQPGGQLYGVAMLGAGGSAGTYLASSASGVGTVIDSSLSAAEISQQLTPGSSGRGPFDLNKYPGFCRKMRVSGVMGWLIIVCGLTEGLAWCCS